MELSTKYQPGPIEEKWYKCWMDEKLFKSVPDGRPSYTIVIPPPNVTGVLHMGHILNNTIQDVLIRRARMQGYNACWVPGTDHASIATEAKVVAKLKDELGKTKWEVGREEFMKHAFEWKEKYGGIILGQLQKLGASCDWDRVRFTMEPKLSAAVTKVFVDLYNKGLIYKGSRMTNWDPVAKTVVSDEEVYHKDSKSKLYHVRYKIVGGKKGKDEYLTIATTRPETILGDTALCLNPNDDRYKHLKGAKVLVPLINREIPVIYDEYVDMEFGTGALKITPAHDPNDFELGKKHNLETIDIFDDEAKLNEKAQLFVGEDRFKARKLMVVKLEETGDLIKFEEIDNKIGYSERTHVVIEPRLTEQWFLKMKDLAEPAINAVRSGDIVFSPDYQKNTYFHWMENVRDWCISRQLWWGQRIPAYYLKDGSMVIAETAEEALKLAKKQTGNSKLTASDLRQDEDVVDTWFSSWLWPISVFDGFESKEEVDYYYPTKVLVTGADIIFFWVARMIIAGIEYKGTKPFDHVYFTGMVRDPQRRKMSKSLGNSPDALKLIEDFGADGVRVGMLMCSPAGGDLLFKEELCEQGRNFCNKMWNALRLVKGWEVKPGENAENKPAITWFAHKFNKVLEEYEDQLSQYRLSEALKTGYSFIWQDFFSDYLEMIKPTYGEPIDEKTYEATIWFFEDLMKMLHPIIPFITEEIYQALRERKKGDYIMVSDYPMLGDYNEAAIKKGEIAKEIISSVRNTRNKNGLSPKETLKAYSSAKQEKYADFLPIILKKANLESLAFEQKDVDNTVSTIIDGDNFMVETGIEIDVEAEKKRLKEELKYAEGFKTSVMKKLGNERFVNNAPAPVLEKERQKLADAEGKIKQLTESLEKLNMN